MCVGGTATSEMQKMPSIRAVCVPHGVLWPCVCVWRVSRGPEVLRVNGWSPEPPADSRLISTESHTQRQAGGQGEAEGDTARCCCECSHCRLLFLTPLPGRHTSQQHAAVEQRHGASHLMREMFSFVTSLLYCVCFMHSVVIIVGKNMDFLSKTFL